MIEWCEGLCAQLCAQICATERLQTPAVASGTPAATARVRLERGERASLARARTRSLLHKIAAQNAGAAVARCRLRPLCTPTRCRTRVQN